ncbi:hypothetical protein [Streptomyces sp. NPDC017435]|uniref:hypothetical protein n=1 Tax=Streptomyces sp. NPDC017435 TaxID=3364995 RepID=UPI0037A2EC16
MEIAMTLPALHRSRSSEAATSRAPRSRAGDNRSNRDGHRNRPAFEPRPAEGLAEVTQLPDERQL